MMMMVPFVAAAAVTLGSLWLAQKPATRKKKKEEKKKKKKEED